MVHNGIWTDAFWDVCNRSIETLQSIQCQAIEIKVHLAWKKCVQKHNEPSNQMLLRIFLNTLYWMEAFDFKQLPMKYFLSRIINNKPALVRILARHRTSDAIINDGPVYWRIYAPLGYIELNNNSYIYIFNLNFGSVLGGIRNILHAGNKQVYLQIGMNQMLSAIMTPNVNRN